MVQELQIRIGIKMGKRGKIDLEKPHIRDFIRVCLEAKVSSRKISQVLKAYFGVGISDTTICRYKKRMSND